MKKIFTKLGLAVDEDQIAQEAEKLASEKVKSFMESEDFDELLEQKAKKLIRDAQREELERKRKEQAERKKKLEDAKENIETYAEYMRDKDEPYVHIRSLEFDTENGIKIDIDWNKSFIKYLNANGIRASSDEETVRVWLAHLSRDINTMISVEQYMQTDTVEKPDENVLQDYYSAVEDDEAEDENQSDH